MSTFGIFVLIFASNIITLLGGQPSIEEICSNIDNRLPCSLRELQFSSSEGAPLGNFIGASTGEDIKKFYESSDSCPIYSAYFQDNELFRQFITDYMIIHQDSFPTEHAELVAMALAANIDPAIAFIQNGCEELGLLLGDDFDSDADPVMINSPPFFVPYLRSNISGPSFRKVNTTEHCSDIGLLSKGKNGNVVPIQGHNEDWWSTVADKMSVISTPDWFGYLYPGQLAGTSLVVTRHGLSLTMNSLYPNVPGFTADSIPSGKGVAFLFSYVLRSIIKLKTPEDIISALSKYPIYAGYSLNVMSACEESIMNIEGYGDKLGISSHHGNQDFGSVIGHYNSYSTLSVDQDPVSTSGERSKCQEKTSFSSPADVRTFLGNLTCPMFFTSINGLRYSETLATWIINPDDRTLSRYRMPSDCDIKNSKCSVEQPSYFEPQSYVWDFSCHTL